MGSTTKVKVSEIFSQAGNAFSRLGELTMQLQTSDDGTSKWTDEEIDMLNTAIGRFSSDLSEISYRVKSRGVSQLKQSLKKKTFEDAGIPVKQVAIVSASQPSQPVAVPVVQQQIHTIHQTQQQILNVQPIPSNPNVQPHQQLFQQIIPSAQPHQQHQQFQFVQHVQPPIPTLVPIPQPIEVTEISTDDQTNDDSQDDEQPSLITDETASMLTITDQSMFSLNRINVQTPLDEGTEPPTSDESIQTDHKLELPAGDSEVVVG